ncbi:26S proteasome non-ATPase regulatory subunit 6-like [Styela clava]|uniref:26S proteasome non-ATPase regulatory subunit 6-like n=1 Tax=Styela clava TaxID=7725 RepID=UPI001939F950|nr:26S proteasome non-ATPase regulatory subunit 6-like [Styela clava]
MPVENLEEEGLKKIPDLEVAQLKFLLTSDDEEIQQTKIKKQFMEAIEANEMAPYYEIVCKELGMKINNTLLKKLKDTNEKTLKKLEDKITETEEMEYESEVRDALLAKAEYLCKIGNKDDALEVFQKAYDKTIALGHKLDIIFYRIRLGLFFMDHDLITKSIEKAKILIEEGGDWDRRNRLKVYEGLYCIAIRDFKKSANLFLDTVSTFTSYELMDYKCFVTYAVYISMLALDRTELREKVVKGSEILEVLHSNKECRSYLFSLYDCHYAEFFQRLAQVEVEMKRDRLLNPHYRYYTREMRILAYTQLLESYRSLTLEYMAEAFGVTVEFIDRELSRFIAVGRLHCKIDKVGGIVETNRPDSKNWQYQETIKKGDLLLNRVQKLSRVINI